MRFCAAGADCSKHCQNCGSLSYGSLPYLFDDKTELKFGDGITKQAYDRMHDFRCEEWTRIKSYDDGLLAYRLLCSKKDTHQTHDPADMQETRLRRLRPIIYKNCNSRIKHNDHVHYSSTPDTTDWSAYPECEECWDVLYPADRGVHVGMVKGKTINRPSSPSQPIATTLRLEDR